MVFTAGPQGGQEPGLSTEQGFWKEKGREPGCLNSWAGSAAASPIHLSPFLLPGLAPCPFLPGGLHGEPSLLDLCGWRAFSALRWLRESLLCVPLSGSVGRMCRHTSRLVPCGSMEATTGDPALTKYNDTEESSDITGNLDLHKAWLLSRHRPYRVSLSRQAREGELEAGACGGAPNPKFQSDPPETPASIPYIAEQSDWPCLLNPASASWHISPSSASTLLIVLHRVCPEDQASHGWSLFSHLPASTHPKFSAM